ncbi:hypothetical protein GW17_00049435 [Ensete ventricosum]|nr:hypothetical protein GW17_00049435 [Ensete ventricosum]
MHGTTQNEKGVNRARDYAPSVRTDQQHRRRCRRPIGRAKKATASSDGRTLVCHERLVAAVVAAYKKRPHKRRPCALAAVAAWQRLAVAQATAMRWRLPHRPRAGDRRGRNRALAIATQAATARWRPHKWRWRRRKGKS